MKTPKRPRTTKKAASQQEDLSKVLKAIRKETLKLNKITARIDAVDKEIARLEKLIPNKKS